MSTTLESLVIVTAVCTGLVAGAFFIFSAFVMRALADLPPKGGTEAMQAVNIRAVTPVFMTALFGTAALCIGVVGWAIVGTAVGPRILLILAGLSYLVGCVGVTIGANVPLNNRLAAVTAGTTEADTVWEHYRVAWTRWNTVRTVAAAAGATMLTIAVAIG